MAHKIRFSKPCAAQWESYNKFYKETKCSVEEFYKYVTQKLVNPFSFWQDNQLSQFIWQMWLADAQKEMLHLFFMDKNLRDWLENLPILDLDGIKEYISENGIGGQQGLLKLDNFYFGIHIPYENKYRGYAFHLMNNQLNQMVVVSSQGQGGFWISDENYKQLLKDNSETAGETTKMFRLAINTIAYMEAFPECIKEGVPKQIKEFDLGKPFSIQVAEKVENEVSNFAKGKMVSPHERRGYFKRLKSNFYTHKKGQIIYVSETMVNGKAKTVYTTEKINKIKTLT